MKLVERTCVSCRKKFNKADLFRLVYNSDGAVEFDAMQRKDGRGYYVCKAQSCIVKLKKNKKITINDLVIEEILCQSSAPKN